MPPPDLASRLTVPIELPAFDKDEDGRRFVHVVVETARGGRNKLAYDEKLGIFRLKKVLPTGMSFPHDFGFVPSTRSGDRDPLDALVLMDAPATTGCLIACRPIGVIIAEQETGGERERNDLLVTVAIPSRTHGDLKHIDELNRSLLDELKTFFVNYHAEYGQVYRVLDVKGPRQAWKQVEDTARTWKRGRKRPG
jgi:inorganic pyrophosphatase